MPRRAATALAGCGLLVSILVLRSLVDQAAVSAACLEQARYFLISCIAPPDALSWTAAIALSIAFAVGIGIASRVPATFRTPGPTA